MNKLNVLAGRLLMGFLFISFFLSCDYRPQDINLKENEELREDVYSQILNDEELFSEFMSEMRESPRSMEQMGADPDVRRHMYSSEQMQHMMQDDPVLMDTIHNRMQRDPVMRRRMMDNMHRRMQEDTVMSREMQEMMQQNREN